MKKVVCVLLILFFGFSLTACKLFGIWPIFPDTPLGHLEKERYLFQRELNKTGKITIANDTTAKVGYTTRRILSEATVTIDI